MGRIYLVKNIFRPNEASTNRFLSFLEGFSKLGVDIEAILIFSDSKNSRIEKQYPHVHVNYLWDILNWKNKYFRLISYWWLTRDFIRKLNEGDIVILCDPQRMLYSLLKQKGIKVYAERTEHPYVVQSRKINTKKYLEAGKKLDGVFVISTALKDFFVDYGYDEDKVHIINMTVDSNRFSAIKKQISPVRYIAYCGTASNNKDGVDDLIKAYSIVHHHFPDIKLYIIGKALTEKDDSGNLQLVERLGLIDDVVFTGIQPSSKMPQILKNAEILALARPNSLQALCGFPTKLGEYLLTENPVVITRVGDIPKFLKDGKTALLAEPSNIQDFANKIIWALEHPVEASIIGKAGSEVAMREFNCVNEVKKIVGIINS